MAMMTLRDLIAVYWTITELSVTARDPDTTHFVHQWEWSLRYPSFSQEYMINDGDLTYRMEKINAHGDAGRGGPEIGWGVKEKMIPKLILDAPITHMGIINCSNGVSVSIDIEMAELTAMSIKLESVVLERQRKANT